jgi:hypothetical protein
MKVKIGNRYYDTKTEPIMFIFETEGECALAAKHRKYCSYPAGKYTREQIRQFMYGEKTAAPREPIGMSITSGTTGTFVELTDASPDIEV